MKYTGCISNHYNERTRDLLQVYFNTISSCSHVSMPRVFNDVVNSPASRFWVSAPRAAAVVSAIEAGDDLHYMRPTKREMFLEIHRRCVLLFRRMTAAASRGCYTSIPLSTPSSIRIVERVVSQPAPKFYMAAGTARIIILKARKEWFLRKSLKPLR